MKIVSMILFLFVVTAAAFEGVGVINDETGECLVERVSDSRLELVTSRYETLDSRISDMFQPTFHEETLILWSVEEWHGAYGAICQDIDVSGNGNYVLCSWSLNYEKWELYESSGSGTPVWTYDLCAGDMTVYADINGDISSDGSVVAGCVPGWRDPSDNYKGTLLKFSNSSSTPDWTYDFPYISNDYYLSSRPVDVRVTSDGSTIVCLVKNVKDDPTKPHQLYVFDSSSSTPTLVIDLPNTDENPQGLDITDDASLMIYSTYSNVYVYDNSGNQVNSFSIDHGWQYTPAISSNGQWMAYGNYHGQLRLNEWNGSEFSLSWQYTITPDYFYPWVCSIDIVNNTIMMSSFQPNASGNRGYAYLFATSSSTPIWTSEDFGDLTCCVALNGYDATAGIAASYGPLSGNGWRSALFMADNATPYYVLDQSYPGSHFACEMSDDGIIAATGGKRVHARIGGSGGWIYCIQSDETGIGGNEYGLFVPFTLNHVRPNPAASTATISFSILEGCAGNVRLELFDLRGRKIETLLNDELFSGEHEVSLDISNLSAGIYLYSLAAGDYVETRKMIAIR